MHTLGNVTKTKMIIEESYLIAKSFLCDTKVAKGTVVKWKEDGTVTPVTATDDVPFGVVTVGNKAVDTKVTVNTYFSAIVVGVADGGVTSGDFVSASGITAGLDQKYKKSAAEDWASGIALTTALDTADVTVGILRTPYNLPA